ncbi:subtilisin-like protein [Myriangium duriaei CBS 260.36]|uniref:Subtilisin-like protein n=1 Tax=Myriangium duriaei CBS 260.36 TaxID=1168546 RepID=A0A9P4J1M6_9PEZI|nr:subtilisin-like protein [Myriangium duriaei CBS 260.36]
MCSKTYGVAKKCSLIAVKVLDGMSGSMSDIMSGYDWAVKDIMTYNRKHKAVINMSLGGPISASFNKLIDTAFDYGITTVVAAGNDNTDDHNSSPASAEGAITVGATDRYRVRAPFSNFGTNVAVFAPGVQIISTWPGGGNRTLSGTSMASPHIAGLALYLQGIRWFYNSKRLKKSIERLATDRVVGDTKGSPNLFAYNNGGSRFGIWG